jgi:hypothetical protein
MEKSESQTIGTVFSKAGNSRSLSAPKTIFKTIAENSANEIALRHKKTE